MMLVMLLWVYIHTGQAWKICLTTVGIEPTTFGNLRPLEYSSLKNFLQFLQNLKFTSVNFDSVKHWTFSDQSQFFRPNAKLVGHFLPRPSSLQFRIEISGEMARGPPDAPRTDGGCGRVRDILSRQKLTINLLERLG
jgi:hypothetical protein